MSAPITAHTISARRPHSSIVLGSTVLIMAAIAIVLMLRSPSGVAPASHGIPAAIYTPLDQHERHPAATTAIYTPLDQHERHLDLFAPETEHAALPDVLDRYLAARDRSTPLDQHERHPAATTAIYTPLDQHERHP